ncbi:MAG: trans-aconitate 2-methyltransferase [Acidobacteriaceae bacterium]
MTRADAETKDWSARQYLRFEEERTRPARDLLAQVRLEREGLKREGLVRVGRVVDLGCGPGNSTELLVERFPGALMMGVDSSKDMLEKARERLPGCEFVEADLRTWTPPGKTDLVFANAVLQWVPEHQAVMRRMVEGLEEGGVLAVQMPDNTREPSHQLMVEVAGRERWARALAKANAARADLPDAGSYYDALKPLCREVEIWHTIYEHVMDGPEAIVEWFKGSSLRPFLAALDATEGEEFLRTYEAEIAKAYPRRVDGRVLLRFPRLFVVATR